MRALRAVGIAAFCFCASFFAGCSREVISCEIARSAISITVQDSVTGALGPFSSVVAVATGTAHKDSLFTSQILPPSAGQGTPKPIQLGYNAPDTYDVTVVADGYKQWSKANVSAPPDNVCASRPVNQQLTAKLVKAP